MNYAKELKNPIFKIVSLAAEKINSPAYIVGGWVRDLILSTSKESYDIDFMCIGSGLELAKEVNKNIGKKSVLKIYKNFGTAMLKINNETYEFVGSRKESYRSNSRKPIIENGTLEDDQNRRDFTINAMSINLNRDHYGELIDPFNGREDLIKKIIRTPLCPKKTYSDDPLRMMRAIRFASQLNFKIENKSYYEIKKNVKRLSIISQERITEELNKIILSKVPSVGFKMLFETKLLHQFFPEMVNLHGVEFKGKDGHKDNFYHTIKVLES